MRSRSAFRRAMRKDGHEQHFGTAILVRGQIGPPIPLLAAHEWVNVELQRFSGNLLAYVIRPEKFGDIRGVAVHIPAWPVERTRLEGVDVSILRLTQNADVWVADVLWASLQHQPLSPMEPWMVGGDFNLSETFDLWPGGPRGNREYLDRMERLGLTECLRYAQGGLTPTFRNPRGEAIIHQMDHLFTTKILSDRLAHCVTGEREQIFDRGLSDHLPIIADFDVQYGTVKRS
jgi:endonuclease/exonuclease/phosphatase family metal-dependent hydrolase